MAPVKPTPPAVLISAIFSCHESALEWAKEQVSAHWGPIGLTSPVFHHTETHYYGEEMGQPLRKQLLMLDHLFDPAELANRKLQTNAWEQALSDGGRYLHSRPVNIDPGYLTLTKLVLASCKDRAHRIYLRDGVYAEECLFYVAGWQSRPWTYPDYLRSDYHQFFSQVRQHLKRLIQAT